MHAYLLLDEDRALRQARETDDARANGESQHPLAGVPIAIKDNICTAGLRTSAASRMLADFVPVYDATVVERLRGAGLIVIGKTNMDEFAMGSSTENSAFGPTRNPWSLSRVPGGTSGGSAAAVAAREAPIALGSDTGGSIRQPASFCGVVGLKPTYGRVSRFGLISYASSFDQIGIIGQTVTDVAALLPVIAGYDENDSTSSSLEILEPLIDDGLNVSALRIGVPSESLLAGNDPEVLAAVDLARSLFVKAGAQVQTIEMPLLSHAISSYYLIATSEASSNLARYDGVKYGHSELSERGMWDRMKRSRGHGFGMEVKRRIALGAFALSAGYYDQYYLKAQRVRTLIWQEYQRAFEHLDLLLMPVSPVPAFAIGEKISDPLTMYLVDVHTVTANMAGVPALAIPTGLHSTGLPLGIQLQGPAFAEPLLLTIGHVLERLISFERPSLPLDSLTPVQP